jgi:predicted O-methyltransferase YrrM
MHPYCEKVLKTGVMETPEGNLIAINSQISLDEGLFLQQVVEGIKPQVTLEIGVAFGISSMFICEVLDRLGTSKHIGIDLGPIKKAGTDELDRFGLGLLNLKRCGYGHLVESYALPSEIALPGLLRRGQRLQFAFIDGWHSFDHAMVDFFYVNKMLDVGGTVVFHDAAHPNIMKLLKYISMYPSYRIFKEISRPKAIFSTQRKGVEKLIAYALFLIRRLYPYRPTCVAMEKICEDTRDWTWFRNF